MNVLILDDAGFGLEGGRGVYGKEIYCELLAKINEKLGNKVLKVVLGGEKSASADVITLEGSRLPVIRTFYDEPLANGLMKLCEKFRIDLIHANILNARYPIILSRILRKLNLPSVITAHSWVYLCPTNYNVMLPNLIPCERSLLNAHCIGCMISKAKLMCLSPLFTATRMLHQTYALRSLLKEANCVISPSKTFAMRLSDRLNIEVYHIPNPVNPRLFEEEPKFEGDGSIVFMGRLEYEKGVHLLLPLAKILNYVNIHVIGRGKLESLFHENKLPNIFYHGFVSEHAKLKHIRKATVVVVPSIWCDMFPTTVFEAFTLGKPVVAFDLGGPKEQIEASGGGLLAKPFEIKDFAEKVRYLLENPSETKRMGLMGRKWVEESLHPYHYARALAKVYEHAMRTLE
jgi:glycosyltransferase involved in cell wall biosynthesis